VLIIAFAGLPEIFHTGYTIHMHFQQTHDIEPGDPIFLRGKKVGVIRSVGFTDDDLLKGITITARIDSDICLPRTIQAKVFSKGLVGKGYLTLTPDGPMPEGAPDAFYHPDEKIVLEGIHDPNAGLLPPELTEAFSEFGALAKNLNELAGDAENQANLKTSLANLARASDKADELMRRLITVAEEVSKLLLTLQAGAEKLNTPEGTAGKFLNDPELYNRLLLASEQMEGLLKDVRRLVQKWDAQGMGVQLK